MIFDVDSHFEPGLDWLDPYPELAAKLPDFHPAITAVEGVAGDLLRMVPEAERPSLEELAPPGLAVLFGEEKAGESERRSEFEGKNQRAEADAAGILGRLVQRKLLDRGVGAGEFVVEALFLREFIGRRGDRHVARGLVPVGLHFGRGHVRCIQGSHNTFIVSPRWP